MFRDNSNPVEFKGFLASMELRLAVNRFYNEQAKMMYFGTYLVDTAQIWFSTVVNRHYDSISYEELATRFQKRFLPVDYAAISRERLTELKQTGSVSEYIKRFNKVRFQWSHPYVNDKSLLDEGFEDQHSFIVDQEHAE
jgi:hypothetical protein